jgi:hypothetical protein
MTLIASWDPEDDPWSVLSSNEQVYLGGNRPTVVGSWLMIGYMRSQFGTKYVGR